MSKGGRAFRRGVGHLEVLAVREVNFLFGRQEHVQWPAKGLSWTGAPGQLPCVAHPLAAAR